MCHGAVAEIDDVVRGQLGGGRDCLRRQSSGLDRLVQPAPADAPVLRHQEVESERTKFPPSSTNSHFFRQFSSHAWPDSPIISILSSSLTTTSTTTTTTTTSPRRSQPPTRLSKTSRTFVLNTPSCNLKPTGAGKLSTCQRHIFTHCSRGKKGLRPAKGGGGAPQKTYPCPTGVGGSTSNPCDLSYDY